MTFIRGLAIRIFQIDTFTTNLLSGNPAAVIPLKKWLSEQEMQLIAAENNLSETAFFVEKDTYYELRWFTPSVEVSLCGHATLAAAEVILSHLKTRHGKVSFDTKSGFLGVEKDGDALTMNFPSRPASPCVASELLLTGLGCKPELVLARDDYIAVYNNHEQVRDLIPKQEVLKKLDLRGVVITAPGHNNQTDYVLRFFAPKNSVPEDPVTGNVQTQLVPYWANRLGKKRLQVTQLSQRGGQMICENLINDRISISGHCVLFMEGEIIL